LVEDDYHVLLVAQGLIQYFGGVDLSDAIQFITDDDELLEACRSLNIRLLSLYSDDSFLMSLQSSTF
jgi:hypothetical protein